MLSAGTAAMGTSAASQVSAFTPAEPAQEFQLLMEKRQPVWMLSSSEEMKQSLIEEEGVRYTVYLDMVGHPTVGVGHLVTPKDRLSLGQTIGKDRILDFLEADLAYAEQAVARLVGDLPLYQHEFDALVDLVFNVGEGNVSESNSPRLNAAIATGDYSAIADELATYIHTDAGVAPGLLHRSERRVNMFTQNDYSNPREATIRQS